jgi:TrmH family RNA methyltransferase
VISEALQSAHDVKDVFVTEDAPDRVAVEARDKGAFVHEVSSPVLRSLADTMSSQGAVAVVSVRSAALDDLVSSDLVLVLAEVRDPGNAGTLVRSALAAGASGAVFVTGTVDPFAPKTIRASAGMIFRLPIVSSIGLDEAVAGLREAELRAVGTDALEGTSIYDADLSGPLAIVIGNEAWGMPDAARELVDEVVSIPMHGPAESINASIAGSVILFEVARRRTELTR